MKAGSTIDQFGMVLKKKNNNVEQKENMNRREALKRMGTSTLALTVGTSGVASLLESCADKPKDVEPVAEATDEVKDLEFTRNWTQKMMEAVGIDKEGDKVLIVHENNTDCLCPMVRPCKGKMATSLCICTETELERMFARAYGGEVKATVTEAILRGDKSCVYRIELL